MAESAIDTEAWFSDHTEELSDKVPTGHYCWDYTLFGVLK